MNPQEQSTIGCVTDPAAGAVAHDAARRPEPMGRSACGFPARAGDGCHETWQPLGSRTRLPHAVFPEPRLLCSCQIIGPRFAVAILHRTTPPATWRGTTPFSTMIATRHSMRCHARTPHSQKLTQRSSAHPTPAAPAPHSPTWGQDPQGAGLALRATVAILHRTTSPATWRGTTPTPTHDCHKGTSRAVPHPLAGSSRQSIHHHA